MKSASLLSNLFAGGIYDAKSSTVVHAAVRLHTEALLVNDDARPDVPGALASTSRHVQFNAGN